MYAVSRYENPYEHSSQDTVDKLDLLLLERVSRTVSEAVKREAGLALTGVTGGDDRPNEAAPGASR